MRLLLIVVVKLSFSSIAEAALPDDSYIAGYAAGVLKHGFKIDQPSLTVQQGIITIQAEKIPADERSRVLQALSEILRVTAIKVEREDAAPQPIAASQSIAEASARDEAHANAITEEGTPATGVMLLQTASCLKAICSSRCSQTRGGHIFPLPTVVMSATTSTGIIMGR